MAQNWRPLPECLSPAEHQLVTLLRDMKDRTGLTLVQLGRRTHHSKSSWHRWLNGERPITPEALRALAGLSGQSHRKAALLLDHITGLEPRHQLVQHDGAANTSVFPAPSRVRETDPSKASSSSAPRRASWTIGIALAAAGGGALLAHVTRRRSHVRARS
jgi:hypothetical protein